MTMSESDVDTATGPYARVDVLITEEQIAERARLPLRVA